MSPLRAFAGQGPYYGWERPLVPTSNVNIGTPRHLQLMHPARWRHAVRCYVQSVVAAFQFVIGSAAILSGVTLQRLPRIAANEIETHWEFWSGHPLHEMERLERQLRPLAAISRVSWAEVEPEMLEELPQVDGISVGTEFNSPCLRVSWGEDRFMRIYAKTTRRLRFEFLHKCYEGRSLLQSRISTDNDEELFGWLDQAAEDAALKINGLLDRMRSISVPAAALEIKRPHQLFAAILSALATLPAEDNGLQPNGQIASDLIEQLVTNGRIALGPNDPQRPAIRRLTSRNVLERTGQEGLAHVYVVSGPYRQALSILRHHHPNAGEP